MQENVSGFQPKAEDLQYPEKLLAAQRGTTQGKEEEGTGNAEPSARSESADGIVNGSAGPSTHAEVTLPTSALSVVFGLLHSRKCCYFEKHKHSSTRGFVLSAQMDNLGCFEDKKRASFTCAEGERPGQLQDLVPACAGDTVLSEQAVQMCGS